jgi:hypothetical protein
MSPDVTTQAVENAVRASQLPPGVVDSLRSQFERDAGRLNAAGFHGPDDIDTLVGLEGVFLWPEDPFTFRAITFTFDSDKVGFQGKYKIVSGILPIEEGVFHCLPNNPAIGFAFIVLAPQGGTSSRAFTFAGIFTDQAGRITIALLNKLGPNGPINPPFSAIRMGLT